MKRSGALCLSLLLICLLAGLAAAEANEQPVKKKNPAVARGLALIPIAGPFAGAAYAGDAGLPDELKATAWTYSLVNVAEIAGAAGLGYMIGYQEEDASMAEARDSDERRELREDEEEKRWIGLGVGAGAGVVIAVITNVFAGNEYAAYCRRYNEVLRPQPTVGFAADGTPTVLLQFRF
ncbi:MAG TPA: hypothetical protein PKW95_22270 [bacterium]|nr:hypothetical protein [bacterium]